MTPAEVKEYLAKIRKTVADSRALVEQAQLRMQETDRFLAKQGLTREQVRNFKVSREHLLAVNEELARRGLPPVEDDERDFDFGAATRQLREADASPEPPAGDELAERRRKFGAFMQEYRL